MVLFKDRRLGSMISNLAELTLCRPLNPNPKWAGQLFRRLEFEGGIWARKKPRCHQMYHEKNWFTRQAGSMVDIIYSWHKIEHVPFGISHKVLFAWKPEHFNVSAIESCPMLTSSDHSCVYSCAKVSGRLCQFSMSVVYSWMDNGTKIVYHWLLHKNKHKNDRSWLTWGSIWQQECVAIYELYIWIVHVENVDIEDRPSDDQDQSETVHQELTLFEIGNSLSKITATVTNRTKTKRTCRL
jgi:hypothetical protein